MCWHALDFLMAQLTSTVFSIPAKAENFATGLNNTIDLIFAIRPEICACVVGHSFLPDFLIATPESHADYREGQFETL